MATKKTMLIVAAATGFLGFAGLAGLAIAGPDWGEGGPGMGHGRKAFWQGMVERYDANKDGKITQDEINNNRQAWYLEFDIDKDGKLSLVEFEKLWLKARHRMMVREFQFLDSDGDGNVTILEYKGPLEDMVADRDRNGDNALSREDRPRGERGKHKWRHREHMQQKDDNGSDDRDEPDDNRD